MVDEVPGEELIAGAGPEGEEVRVDGAFPEGPAPAEAMGGQQQLAHPAVTPGQQGLDVSPFGQVGVDPHLLDAVKFPGY